MTQKKDGTQYYYYLCAESETIMPREIRIKSTPPKEGSTVTMLGYQVRLDWEMQGEGFRIKIPKGLREHPPCEYVWTFVIK